MERYQQTAEEIQQILNGHLNGLSENEVRKKREVSGYNELQEGKKKTPFIVFLEQFKDFLVIILLISATVSGIMGDSKSAVVILLVITMNAILGTVQTFKAESSLNNLKKLSGPEAKVLRDGTIIKVQTRELVPGDIVSLEAGDYIPADGRIIENAGLKVDESTLTGESVPVEKSVEIIRGEVPLADRTNMVFSGSFVTYGRGNFVVTDTGMNTETGKIASLLKNTSEKKTPLQVNLDAFGRKLSIMIIVLCGFLFAISLIRGQNPGDAFMFAVALAVAAIPEALSSIVTIVLSFGTRKMASENAIVRKLQAVEGLGSVSVVCSDKTGTLTQNKMTVEDFYVYNKNVPVENVDEYDNNVKRLISYSVLCNDSIVEDGQMIGDPTETALVLAAKKGNMSVKEERETFIRLSEIPFDSDRKLMSTLHKINGKYIMIVKGAEDVIQDRVCKVWSDGKTEKITEKIRKDIELQNEKFSEEGLRVLGFAYKEFDELKELSLEDESNLTFLGLVAMMDPPREESRVAVEECKKAGIKPVMITGDHKITAAAIAKRIGILDNIHEAVEGQEIDKMSDEELKDFVEGISVYARVSPEHKIRIVRAWQEKGNIVAMTGDGVNDAPALKQADIGVAMGITGTEVSKDAAAMVLADDNFSTIVKAVENGRNVYKNIKNAIGFLLSGNFGAILAVIVASAADLPVPFAPVHLLFINLLTDSLPAIALGLEPHTKIVMDEKPRPANENIMTKDFLYKIGFEGLVVGTMTMTGFIIGLNNGGALMASTYAFGVLCLSRLFHGFNCKMDRCLFGTEKMFNNKYLLGAFGIGVLLLAAVFLIPALQSVFKVVPLDTMQLMTIVLLAALVVPVVQIVKWLRDKLVK